MTIQWPTSWNACRRCSTSIPELLDGVVADLGVSEAGGRGRHGLTCESVLRYATLLHLRQATYWGLEFLLRDSLSAQRFARVDTARLPGKSALQSSIGAIGAATWERINRRLLDVARGEGIESGERVRVDSTVTETHILAPADSRLLYDGVIIVKGGRGTYYGHKVNLATGLSGLALDAVVEDGNPVCLKAVQPGNTFVVWKLDGLGRERQAGALRRGGRRILKQRGRACLANA